MPDDDQVKAATAEATDMLRRTLGPLPPQQKHQLPKWAEDLLDHALDNAIGSCQHLHRRPVQPAFAYAWEHCRRDVGPQRLTPTVFRVGFFVLFMAVCPRCMTTWEQAGARLVAAEEVEEP